MADSPPKTIIQDRLLHTFMSFADNLSGIVMEKGHFCDYIDPCSGLPFHSGGNNVYDEVQGMQVRGMLVNTLYALAKKDLPAFP